MTPATCDTCRHGRRDLGAPTIACRRYPPVPTAILVPAPPTPASPNGGIALQNVTGWPQVNPTDACGEHSPRLVAK